MNMSSMGNYLVPRLTSHNNAHRTFNKNRNRSKELSEEEDNGTFDSIGRPGILSRDNSPTVIERTN